MLNCTPCQCHFYQVRAEYLILYRKKLLYVFLPVRYNLTMLSDLLVCTMGRFDLTIFNLSTKDTKFASLYRFMSLLNNGTDSRTDLDLDSKSNSKSAIYLTVTVIFSGQLRKKWAFASDGDRKRHHLRFPKHEEYFPELCSQITFQQLVNFLSFPGFQRSIQWKGSAQLEQLIYHNVVYVSMFHGMWSWNVLTASDNPCNDSVVSIWDTCGFFMMKRLVHKMSRWIWRRLFLLLQLVFKPCAVEPQFESGIYWFVVCVVGIISSTWNIFKFALCW